MFSGFKPKELSLDGLLKEEREIVSMLIRIDSLQASKAAFQAQLDKTKGGSAEGLQRKLDALTKQEEQLRTSIAEKEATLKSKLLES